MPLSRRQKAVAPEFRCLESKDGWEVDALNLQDICREAGKFGCLPQHHKDRLPSLREGGDSCDNK
jgi:hypothetical protein